MALFFRKKYYNYGRKAFFDEGRRLFVEIFIPGAMKLGGELTASQGGCMIGAGLNIGVFASAEKNGTDTVNIELEGFGKMSVDIGDTEMREAEKGDLISLVRGICDCFIESGNIFGGFDAKMVSEIPEGSGIDRLSTFETAVGSVISALFFGDTVPALVLAGFCKRAENEYFGKPSELAEKLICAEEKTVFMDFEDPFNITFDSIDFDFSKCGYKLILADSETRSSDFDIDRKNIAKNMKIAAMEMGCELLSETAEVELYALSPLIRQKYGEQTLKNAIYYYEEKRRAVAEAEALWNGDFGEFLRLYGESAESFEENISNTVPENEQMELFKKARDRLKKAIGENGVCGNDLGGFLPVFVKEDYTTEFMNEMSKEGCKCFLAEIL